MKTEPQDTAPADAPTDGRALRSERSHQAIVAALFELVGQGLLKPTAQQVAERAGVGIRTVFRHFSDMDTLYSEFHARLHDEIGPLLAAPVGTGSIAERIDQFVARRASLFERIAPYIRSGDAQCWHSPYLQEKHRSFVGELRFDLLRWLPELEPVDPDVTCAAELATSFRAWEHLRQDQRLSAKRAASAMQMSVHALIRSAHLGARD